MSKPALQAILVTMVVALISLGAMEIYRENVLRGDIANHTLSARMYGVGAVMAKHGIRPFLEGEAETGWDGQFYYAISNDLLARTDVAKHVDAPAYRYQRIGLPLAAWLVSRLTLRDWVPPLAFYLTNVGIVLFATFVAARHFSRSGAGAWWAFLWATSLGVQLTMLNGLPDAAADAFLILSMVFLVQGRRAAYLAAATFAALTREAYILLPAVLALIGVLGIRHAGPWRDRVANGASWVLHRGWPVIVPLIVFVAWQGYVRWTFGRAPASYAGSIVGIPMRSWYAFTSAALGAHHPLAPPGWPSTREAIGLLFFAFLLCVAAWVAIRALRRTPTTDVPTWTIATFFAAIVALYACFGDTVILNYTGYMKSASLLFVVVPFLAASVPRVVRIALASILAVANLFFASYLWHDRIASPPYEANRYQRSAEVKGTQPIACLRAPKAAARLVGIEPLRPDTLAGTALNPHVVAFKVSFTNASTDRYEATNAAGSVNYSSLWLTADGNHVLSTGPRSFLPEGLGPGESRTVPILVEIPRKRGQYLLRLSPLQEGCGWFYDSDPASKVDLAYTIR